MNDSSETQGLQITAPVATPKAKPDRKSLRKTSAAVKTATKAPEAAQAVQAAAKPKKAPKAAAKAAEKPKFNARKMAKGKPIYVLDQHSRPGSGPLLLAHTHAALTVLGLLDEKRPVVKKSELLTLVGQRAVVYHGKKGNLEDAPGNGIRLSTLGYNTFTSRMRDGKINVEAANAFVDAFLEGKPNPLIHATKSNLYSVAF